MKTTYCVHILKNPRAGALEPYHWRLMAGNHKITAGGERHKTKGAAYAAVIRVVSGITKNGIRKNDFTMIPHPNRKNAWVVNWP